MQKSIIKKKTITKKPKALVSNTTLHHLAFDRSLQANIITNAKSGTIITANAAACKLLGYSKLEIINKNRTAIFDIQETSFKAMLKQRTAEGESSALVTVIKKNGQLLTCEITSAIFLDENGIKKAITTVVDRSQSIRRQQAIDKQKEKLVIDNIALAKSDQKRLDIKNEKIVADNIDQAISDQKVTDIKNKKLVADNITIAKSDQKKIDIKNQKIVADNIILAQAKSDDRQSENNKWKKYIAETSYDVMWDWNIATGEIYTGESVEEIFGYKLPNNISKFTFFLQCLLPEEKSRLEEKLAKTLNGADKNWDDFFMFKRKDGSMAAVTSRANIIRNEQGIAVHLIGATQDISKLQELKKKLAEQIIIKKEFSDIFHLAAKLSYDGIWDWNIVTNEFFLGEGFEELIGYTTATGTMADWSRHLHPDDKETVEQSLQDALRSSNAYWEQAYRFIKSDGSVANVYGRASIIRNAEGKAYRMIGAIHDLTRQKELEEKLELEIRLKEKQIADASEDAKDAERSDIGKELHDNINQLLGASKMYLDMAQTDDEHRKMYLNQSSEYTVSAIEEIRKLTRELTTDIIRNFGLCEAIETIARDTMQVNPIKIACVLETFAEDDISEKFKLNVFRIVQEQVNNILKHAQATAATISLSRDKKSISLEIADNGIGFDTGIKGKGIGLDNIKSRAVSYKGHADFISKPGTGCVLIATFPVASAEPV
jgi:PAS domain S-box-containing protein